MHNKDNFALPTPQELAKKAHETTVPVSFRIKESTHAVFSGFAKQYKTTVGALVNELLDSYVDQYNSRYTDMIDVNDVILDDYINKKAIRLSKNNDSELYTRISQSGLLANYDDNASFLAHDVNEIKTSKNHKLMSIDGNEPRIVLGDRFNTSVVASNKKSAEISIEEDFESKNDRSYILEVPAAKWALVSAILCAYVKKFVTLYGCKESCQTFLIDERTLRGIEKVINKKQSDAELAKQIAQQLNDFKESDD